MTDLKDNNKIRTRRVSSKNQGSPVDANKKRPSARREDELYRRTQNKGKRYPSDVDDDMKTYRISRKTSEERGRLSSDYKYDDRNVKRYNPNRSNAGNSGKRDNVVDFSSKSSKSRDYYMESSYDDRNDSYERDYRPKQDPMRLKKNNLKVHKSSGSNRDLERYRSRDVEQYEDDYYRQKRKNRRKNIAKKVLKKAIAILLVIFIIGGTASFLYVKSITSKMPVLTKKMVTESYINKNPVPLSKIPKTLQDAVIAVEDNRFYEHGGIDERSILRSAINNLFSSQIQGGSTIDMQLSKNLLTNNQRTMKRKIQDIYNAIMLNRIMTKKEILEAYLNNIYMGKSAYGVEAGAQLYFGKNVWELNFGECTMLAGITNNPGIYQNYEEAKKRQAVVLYRMYKEGYISETEYKDQKLRDTPFKSEIDK